MSRERFPIGELAARTGVAVPTLRAWEARFGFPTPERGAGGHRRYDERDAVIIRRILEGRLAGLSLEAAIARARATAAAPERSLFAGLRRRHPDLAHALFPKPVMLALSRAIEDESIARAGGGLLVGCFQRERHYRESEARWRELARTAGLALVLAAFPRSRRPRGGPAELPLPRDAPLRREWALVCDAPGFAACLVGWEVPGTVPGPRRFEAVWTTEPALVREAAHLALGIAAETDPAVAEQALALVADPVPAAPEGLRRTNALTGRMLEYVSRAAGL